MSTIIIFVMIQYIFKKINYVFNVSFDSNYHYAKMTYVYMMVDELSMITSNGYFTVTHTFVNLAC